MFSIGDKVKIIKPDPLCTDESIVGCTATVISVVDKPWIDEVQRIAIDIEDETVNPNTLWMAIDSLEIIKLEDTIE